MEQKCLPREQIVLYPEERDGRHCIRIDYAGSRRIAELLAVDSNVQTDSTGSAHLDAEGFSLPDFYDRYSPHAYIDYSRVYVRHPKPKREYTLPEAILSYWSGNGTAHRP